MNIIEAFNLLNLSQTSATQTEIKKAYKVASIRFHPDKNPAGLLMMQAINCAYDFLRNLDSDPVIVNDLSDATYYDYGEKLNNALNVLITLIGLDIEVCGNWIWIEGDTYTHKDAIKELGCKWASKKKKWYFRPEEHKCRFGRDADMDSIRVKYGSQKVSTRTPNALPAYA